MKPIYTHLASAVTLSFVVAACVPQPESTPTPTPTRTSTATPTPTPPPVVTQPVHDNWMDAPQTPGDWNYRKQAGGSISLYGKPETEADFYIRCTPQKRIVTLGIAGNIQTPVSVLIRTETRDRVFPGQTSTGDLPHIEIELPANDPLLDALAISKGRFAVEAPGLRTLYIPSWPEVTRVIEDCR